MSNGATGCPTLAFGITADLARIAVSTLAVGGGRDGFFSPELVGETAAAIPDGAVYVGRHMASFSARGPAARHRSQQAPARAALLA